jgi:hypothetical protein
VKGKPVVYLKGSKLKRIKNSKAGRKFIIAATAFVALAVPATANAAVSLGTGNLTTGASQPTRTHNYTATEVFATNGWRPILKTCQSLETWDNWGNLNDPSTVRFTQNPVTGSPDVYLWWGRIPFVNDGSLEPYVTHATFSCAVTKTKISYSFQKRHFTKAPHWRWIRVKKVTRLYDLGKGSF